MPHRRQDTIKFLTFNEIKRLFGAIKAEGNKRDRARRSINFGGIAQPRCTPTSRAGY
jgi:hypothetical protein